MTQPQQRSEVSNQVAVKSPAIALVVWLAGQLALLAAIWADLRISVNANHTAGQIGTHLLLAGQLILSAALFTDIARTARLAAITFAISFPMTQLAGWKCESGSTASLLDSAVLLTWLTGLLCWMQAAHSARAKHLTAAAIMLWIAGTPLLWYILAEFAPGSTVQHLITMTSPVMLVVAAPHLLMVVTIHTTLAAIAAVIAHRQRLS